MIYFDQAASSFPKPQSVADAVYQAVTEFGANPGRGGHTLAKIAADKINTTRSRLAQFFGLKNPNRVIFYSNATGALNQGIKGMEFKEGDHIISTSYEHNSVRRPLEYVKSSKGVDITYISPDHNGAISEKQLEEALQPSTKMIVTTHGSNLTGAILPIEKIGEFSRKHRLVFMVDASQTAGILPIHMGEIGIDLLAFAGHKGLLGPQGTGALLVNSDVKLSPLLHGGTGSHSEGIIQPDVWPERFESGTLNTPGICGLLAGIEEVNCLTLEYIFNHEQALANACIKGLANIENVKVFGPDQNQKRLGVVSFIIQGIDSHEVAMILDQHYGIAVRAGIHCTPLAHESLGTLDTGAIRASFGPYNHEKEIQQFIQAIEEIKVGLIG